MATIIELQEIMAITNKIDVISAMKEGFIHYSKGNSMVPPVGELIFADPPGDVHIKYGYIKNQDYYVIKIASGFYNNMQIGIPTGQGLMLLFSQKTGQPEAILLDEGYLTNTRTVCAGALAAQYFRPEKVEAVGIIGTGTIAKMQIQVLMKSNYAKSFSIWGRNQARAQEMISELGAGQNIHIAGSAKEVAQKANVIISTTPAESPLLFSDDIRPGTLIVAIGSDTQDKQELDSATLGKAHLLVADSISQSKSRGEIYQAVKAGAISEDKVVELGTALQNENMRGTAADQIVVVDLTGVAVQDIMIASAVYAQFKNS